MRELSRRQIYRCIGHLEELAVDWATEEQPQEKRKKRDLLCLKMLEGLRPIMSRKDGYDLEQSECVMQAVEEVLGIVKVKSSFCPDYGKKFLNYFYDCYEHEVQHYNKKYKSTEKYVSLDEQYDCDEEDGSLGSDRDYRYEDKSSVSPDDSAEVNSMAVDYVALINSLIIHFHDHKPGKSGNETRRGYYRLFYTADVVQSVKDSEYFRTAYTRHERDTFEAMNCNFLDFFMSQICRTIPELIVTRLKPYCDTGLNHPDDHSETRLSNFGEGKDRDYKLPQDVYQRYMRDIEGKEIQKNTLTVPHQEYVKDQRKITMYLQGEN